MKNVTGFRPHLSAVQAHEALQMNIKIADAAQQCAVLWFGEIMSRRLYRELGYSSMRAYALEELGFSSTRAGDFMRLASKLESLPVVKEEVVRGKLGYTQAREIIKVADKDNEKQWVQIAQQNSREHLVRVVKQAKEERGVNPLQNVLLSREHGAAPKLLAPTLSAPKSSAPIRVGFELSPAQYARYEAMMAKIGHRGDKAELLLTMLEALLASDDVAPWGAISAPRYQVSVHHCPACERHSVVTPQGEKTLSETESELVCCDAQVVDNKGVNRSSISPKTRRFVLSRDRHQCRRKGCHHTRYLDIHHLKLRSHGGSNDSENLVTLCTGCHHLWHEKGGDLLSLLRPVRPSSER